VTGHPAVVDDDKISTGSTIEAAIAVVLAHGGATDVTVPATHGLLVGRATARLAAAGVQRLVVTDTIGVESAPPVEVCSIGTLLREAIGRLHDDQPLGELLLDR
jgi:ribose-phosphate pyrophosphokinase